MKRLRQSIANAYAFLKKDIVFYVLILALVLMICMLIGALALDLLDLSTVLTWFGISLLIFSLCIFFGYFLKSWISRLTCWLMLISLSLLSFFQISATGAVRYEVTQMCAPLRQSDQVAVIYTSKDTPIETEEQLDGKKVGMLSNRNETLNQKVMDVLEKENVTVEPVYYDTLQNLLLAMKKQSVSALLLNDYDMSLLRSTIEDDSYLKELVKIGSFNFERKNLKANTSININRSPFTVLTKLYTSTEDDRLYDLALLVVNPIIKNVYVALIPRDYYVNYNCEETACTISTDKIALADYLSDEQLVKAVEYLLNAPVDFVLSVQMNELLNVLGLESISVENNREFTFKDSYFEAGTLEIKAEKAKLYTQAITDSSQVDRSYLHHPFQILESFLDLKLIDSKDDFQNQLDTLSRAISSNFTYGQLCTLLKVFFFNQEEWSYEIDELQGNDGFVYSQMLTSFTYVITPNQTSLNNVSRKISFKLTQTDPSLSVEDEPFEIIIYEQPAGEEIIPDEFYEDEFQEEYDDVEEAPEIEYNYDFGYNDYYNDYYGGYYDSSYDGYDEDEYSGSEEDYYEDEWIDDGWYGDDYGYEEGEY